MEYMQSQNRVCDDNYMRHVGWSTTVSQNSSCYHKFFSPITVNIISRKVTELLMGVNPENKPIKVTDRVICGVMSQVFDTFRPTTGDIYGRYNVPNGYGVDSYVQNMIDQTIEIIYSEVRTTLEMEENNKKLTIWTTVYGDFNEHGLRQHSYIKTRNKKPSTMQFNMNY